MFPKPKRIKDKKAKDRVKSKHCEVCGNVAYGNPHHIETVGSGGPDHSYNQIQLCWGCHYIEVPGGRLTKRQLFERIARREGISVDEVIQMVTDLKRLALVQMIDIGGDF